MRQSLRCLCLNGLLQNHPTIMLNSFPGSPLFYCQLE
uniref:Uncharacterized protein n=1 Tax=Rhizophora mucronata TaxID=61149 RepID=A0A2P2Q3G3_RHIMU